MSAIPSSTVELTNTVPKAPGAGGMPDTKVAENNQKKPSARRHNNRYGCRTTQYQPPGTEKIGLSKENQPAQIVHEVHFGLDKAQRDALGSRFPGVAFVCVGAENHDHPVAHLSQKVVWDHSVVNKLRPGERALDVYGNPAYNEWFNARSGERGAKVDSACYVHTPKDAVRRGRWGPRVVGTRERWLEVTHDDLYRTSEKRKAYGDKYDTFLFNHSLYYLPMEDINRIVNLRAATDERAGTRVLATIHRFGTKLPGGEFDWTAKSGTLNSGEQKWTRDVDGVIVQTNVLTGEVYTHKDVEPFFRNFQYADEHGGMAWTVRLGCEDHYVLEFHACPPNLIMPAFHRDGVVHVQNKEGERVSVDSGVTPVAPPRYEDAVRMVRPSLLFGKTNLPVMAEPVPVVVTHPDLLDRLTQWMALKPRNASTFKDLVAKAQRETGNSTLIGGTGKRTKITASELRTTVVLAFIDGMNEERALLSMVDQASASSLSDMLKGKRVDLSSPRAVLRAGLQAALLVRSTASHKSPPDEALRVLEDWI